MSIEKELQTRSESKCELCSATDKLKVYEIPPVSIKSTDKSLLVCETCLEQIETFFVNLRN